MNDEFLYQDLTYEIIGAAMEVHNELGVGYLETVYQNALSREFEIREMHFDQQFSLNVTYKGSVAGKFRADFLVDEKVIIEIKAIKTLFEIQEAQLINYLKGTEYRVGLVINFGSPSLEYKRRVV